MATNETPCLIDWNSPVMEFNCKPLIPLPNFDGQIQFNEDNPFDAVERQINENEPFEMVLNSSKDSIRTDFQDSDRSPEMNFNLIELLEDMNVNEFNNVSKSALMKTDSSLEISQLDLSPVGSNISDLKNRLTELKRRSFLLEPSSETKFINCSAPQLSIETKVPTEPVDSLMNNGFIEKDLKDAGEFDVLVLENDSAEDLISIDFPWDAAPMISSDEENEFSSPESLLWKNIAKIKKEKEPVKKSVRPPLTVRDPNVRMKKAVKLKKEQGPLKAVVPVENMTKTGDKKQNSRIRTNCSGEPKSNQSLMKKRSVPVATSTPTNLRNKTLISHSKSVGPVKQASFKNSTRSFPPSPDSTSSHGTPRLTGTRFNSKTCSRKLALNAVSSSTNLMYAKSAEKNSSKTKCVLKSTATGVKSCVKNKENRPYVSFRY